jgi:hypothetical protein
MVVDHDERFVVLNPLHYTFFKKIIIIPSDALLFTGVVTASILLRLVDTDSLKIPNCHSGSSWTKHRFLLVLGI